MNINLHIERLILDGLSIAEGQGQQVQRAVEQHLTALLADARGARAGARQGLLGSGATLYRLQAPGIQMAKEAKPACLGEQIAGAVYGGLAK